jgi:agmatine/peptidylarginine deiminase
MLQRSNGKGGFWWDAQPFAQQCCWSSWRWVRERHSSPTPVGGGRYNTPFRQPRPQSVRVMRRLVAEWEPQQAVLLVWPHPATDWAADLERAEAAFLELAAAIARFEDLILVCRDPQHRAHVETRCLLRGIPPGRLRWAVAPYDDTWARDFGPLSVRTEHGLELVDFRFDGWGGKYPAAQDDRLTATIAAQGVFGGLPVRAVPTVLEGGAIDTDGRGTLLASEHCLLDPFRNPGITRTAVAGLLRAQLGVGRVHWIRAGWLEGDDTDGHVDNLVRFAGPHTLVHATCEDPADPHFEPLRALARELSALRTPSGQPYRLVPLPLPEAVSGACGRRLPASYVNFLIINGAVLVPRFGRPQDARAGETLAALFPDREIMSVDARLFVTQNGGIHCLTMPIAAP